MYVQMCSVCVGICGYTRINNRQSTSNRQSINRKTNVQSVTNNSICTKVVDALVESDRISVNYF